MKNFCSHSRLLSILVGLGLTVLSGMALAQGGAPAFPSKPIKLVVPYTPGSAPDTLARLIGVNAGASLGGSAYVENRPGASGLIGTAMVASAAADGYTLLVAPSTHVVNPAIRKTSYDPITDFVAVAQFTTGSFLIICPPANPAKSLAELVSQLKTSKRQLTYSSPGIASTVHLFTEMFLQSTGTTALHVPGKGVTGALMDVLQSNVDFTISPIELALPQVRAGKVRALAQTSGHRELALPDVPTVRELGFANYEATYWVGLFAPANTPPAIVEKLNRSVNEQLSKVETIKSLEQQGVRPKGGTPAQFADLVRADLVRFRAVVKQSNIVAE